MDSSTNSAANHHYALQVALQTMKARCIALQRRLTSVEEENKELREQVEKQVTAPPRAADNVELRIQVSELQRQMTQLTEHSNMVSNENRKLWSKLSQISKEQSQHQQAQSNAELEVESPRGNSSNLNLIRSKTFTQHSPNPQLRHKLISNKVGGGGDAGGSQYDSEDLNDVEVELSQISLDDVNLNDLGEEKQRNGAVEAEEVPYAEAALGFGYLNEAEATVNSVFEAASFGSEFKKMLEGLQAMRQAAQQQQDELYAAINVLECNKECAKLAHKPEMADKSLETDDSLNDVNLLHNNRNSRSSSDYNLSSNVQQNGILKTAGFTQRLNIIEEKIAADASDKTCPMCGKLFAPNVQFREFQEHVEMHFTEDTSDLEHSIERQYEYISHTVGDF